MKKGRIIYTIGHSTRPLTEFIAMLRSFNVKLVADVRSLPGSRKYPQYDKEELEVSLPQNTIQYLHLLNLGGRRKAAKDSKNTAWRHPAFKGYADYMETEPFKKGVEELERKGAEMPTAFMCSEAVWWRCHRAMISDHLKSLGWDVRHIMAVEKAVEHPYTSPAKIINGRLTYEENI